MKGFIPKAHLSSYYSKTFPEICNAALKDFAEDQANHKQRTSQLHELKRMQESADLLSSQRGVITVSLLIKPKASQATFSNTYYV